MAKIWEYGNTSIDERVEKLELSHIAGPITLESSLAVSYKFMYMIQFHS